MSQHAQACLDRAWPIICQLVHTLSHGLKLYSPGMPGYLRLLHLARLSESLIRRWLIVNACLKGLPALRVRKGSQPDSVPTHSRETQPEFRLLEPERSCREIQPHPVSGPGPCLTWMDQSRQVETKPAPLPVFNKDRLAARCDALQGVIENRDKHINRMARWLARAADRNRSGACRILPLRVGSAPGASQAQKRKDPKPQIMLGTLNQFAADLVYQAAAP